MALQTLANKMGVMLSSMPLNNSNSAGTNTLDAAGESVTCIGKIFLEGGTGTKTISSSGGAILWRSGTVTFANAGTNLRIGIQDVDSTGVEDGTFDVYADLVGGTDTISNNTDYITPMESGTKDLTHGSTYAISFETTTRGGADSVIVINYSSIFPSGSYTGDNFPYKTIDTGGGPTRISSGATLAMIIFDDGTLGWIEPLWIIPTMASSAKTFSFSADSATDEYACSFKVPFKCSIHGAFLPVGSVASTDTFEIILYSDPLGTPVAEQTVIVDPNFIGSASANAPYYVSFTAEILSPDTWYAIALRPTSNNTITLSYFNMASGNDKFMRPSVFGENMQLGGRVNQTGAFTEVQTYYFPIFGIMIDQLDDGVQTGGNSTTIISGVIGE